MSRGAANRPRAERNSRFTGGGRVVRWTGPCAQPNGPPAVAIDSVGGVQRGEGGREVEQPQPGGPGETR
ncbi:hypothetical protein ACFFX0_02525 [Citricoccus parietis]|uniref:Uncharacterized protein n=1 Tax=Citricoccus parietis TaxID=592307 RepID=A0ABV5FTX5_9MICC